MVDKRLPISIRGDGPWQGRNTLSVMSKKEFSPKELVNCYISPDGKELRSFPGFKCIANIDYEAEFIDSRRVDFSGPIVDEQLNAWSKLKVLHGFTRCRGRTAIVGESLFRRYTPTFSITSVNIISAGSASLTVSTDPTGFIQANEYVYIEGLTSVRGLELVGKFYQVAGITTSSITVSPGGTTFGSEADTGSIMKVRQTTAGGTKHDQDLAALTAYWIEEQFDTSSVALVGYPSQVANRQRDFGDALTSYQEGYIDIGVISPGQTGISRRKQKAIPFRVGLESAGDKILVPIPGYGCVFQIPVTIPHRNVTVDAGIESHYNGGHDRPRSLGVPKGMLVEDATIRTANTTGLPAGDYKFAIAYKDQYTGEIGLASNKFTVTVTLGDVISIGYVHPAYVLSECLALTMMVYASGPGQDALGFLGEYALAEYGLGVPAPAVNLAWNNVASFLNLPAFDWSGDIDYSTPEPRIPQMFMGSKTIATVRGYTFAGGHYGTHGILKSMQFGQLFAAYTNNADPVFKNLDEVQALPFDAQSQSTRLPFNVALGGIPPAYAGASIFSDEVPYGKQAGEELFKPPTKIATLDSVRNAFGTTSSYYRWLQRWKVRQNVNIQGVIKLETTPGDAYLILPQGQISFSEQAAAHAAPATNRIYLDNIEEEDTEMLGRSGNSLISCTRNQTFEFSWGTNPMGSNPILMSSEIGSIAYNAFVEYDGGCAWIGERGPVNKPHGEGPSWMLAVEEDFIGDSAVYLRDSRGLMPHAWAAHDRERSLVYFGLRADVHNTDYVASVEETDAAGRVIVTADGARSKVPCDEVLVWSYKVNSFSVWRPPSGLAVQWMERVLCNDGIYRMCFLAEDGRIYAMDDSYMDTNREPVLLSGTSTGLNGTIIAMSTVVDQIDAPGIGINIDNDNIARIGMDVIQYRNMPDGTKKFIQRNEIAGFPAANQVQMRDSFSWENGDQFLIGGVSMSFETHAESFGDLQEPKRLLTASLRHSVYSSRAEGALGPMCLVNVTGGTELRDDQPISNGPREIDGRNKKAHQTLCDNQSISGHELRIKVEAFGGQQIRLHDIEIGQAEKRS